MNNYYLFILTCLLLTSVPRVLADKPTNDRCDHEPAKSESRGECKDHEGDHDRDGRPCDHNECDQGQDTKAAAIMQEMAKENSKRLDFFGKVIDQYGAAVAGVKIKAGVGTYVSFDHSGGKDYYTESDANGRFSFVGIHGAGVGFTLTKDGYEFNQRLPAASRPDDYVADATKPTLFTMWKLQGAEPMVHCEGRYSLACDGTSTNFDLLTGKTTSGTGDLTVSLIRNPLNIDRRHPFDWTMTLQIAGGGLILVPDGCAYMNEAPASGYQSTVTVSMSASDPKWSFSYRRPYYFKARNGQVYGRVTVSLTANYQPPPTRFRLEIYANPNSSRNLEFDREKQVKY